jgi:hypothetical protein
MNKIALYVLSYNCPAQFLFFIDTALSTNKPFLRNIKKILIDGSTSKKINAKYDVICKKYNFTHIIQPNLGVSGSRQYAAEHFETLAYDYMFYFEDSKILTKKKTLCRNGFNINSFNVLNNSLDILKKENLDYIKLSFTEAYSDNSEQWAWVYANDREKYWPGVEKWSWVYANDKEKYWPCYPTYIDQTNLPKTEVTSIDILNQTPYSIGQYTYSNWPHLITKEGNKKLFLTNKYTTTEWYWCLKSYQLLLDKQLKTGVLLQSPITNRRVQTYNVNNKKEF